VIIEVLSVCRRPPGWVTDAAGDYAGRFGAHIDLRFKYVAPGRDTRSVDGRRRDEAKRLAKTLEPNTLVIALDASGDEHTSEGLARRLTAWRAGHDRMALVIGGPDGLDPAFLAGAHGRWCLSKLTLPHLLVQILVAEQIYRAWTILEGHPYHRV
jgi:23S rRNA (pseudouridine1915-N3)-methyltransferase